MMYPWKNNGKRQSQQHQSSSQRSSALVLLPIINTSGGGGGRSGYTTLISPAPSRSASNVNDGTTSTHGEDVTSINSQNPNDDMMDSVFNACLFSDDEVTVTRDGGYLYPGGSDDHEDNIEVSSNRQPGDGGRGGQRALAIRESMPDTTTSNEQGFEMQKGRSRSTPRRSGRSPSGGTPRRSSSSTPRWSNNEGRIVRSPYAKSTTGISSAGSTTLTSADGNDDDNDYKDAENYNNDDDDDRTSSISNVSRNILSSSPNRTTAPPGFWATLLTEFVFFYRDDDHDSGWYSVRDTVTGRRLDIAASFAPKPTAVVLTLKLLSTLLVLGTIAYSLWDFHLLQESDDNGAAQDDLYFWLSYFTNWSLIVAAVYQVLSLCNTLCFSTDLSRRAFASPSVQRVTGRVQWTWIFFTMALHAQVLAACMFWIAWFQPSHYKHVAMSTTNATSSSSSTFMEDAAATASSLGFYYLTIVPHSLTVIAVAVDGLVVNRIPLRLMHWWGWVLGFNLLYIAWTMIRSLVLMDNDSDSSSLPLTEYGYLYSKYLDTMNNNNITTSIETIDDGNNNNEAFFNLDNYTVGVDSINNGMDSSSATASGTATSSTAVYSSNWLNWQGDNWPLAAIQAVILCFVISPILYILLWTLSLYSYWPFCCCVGAAAQDRRRYVDQTTTTTTNSSPPRFGISIREIGGGGPSPPRSSSRSPQHDRDHVDNERQQKTNQQSSPLFGISFW
jgi:hypothetical protein